MPKTTVEFGISAICNKVINRKTDNKVHIFRLLNRKIKCFIKELLEKDGREGWQ